MQAAKHTRLPPVTQSAMIWFFTLVTATCFGDEPVSFNSQIRLILSDNCYRCHGPDEQARKAGLRLDRRGDATAAANGIAAIVPGDPSSSKLIERITSTDPGYQMPPPSTKKQLSEKQKQLLARWISQGAVYDEHWSFLPIKNYRPPAVRNVEWVRNPIDRFILARLEPKNITPSTQADPYTLIKRLYIDLVGLLPSPREVESYSELFQRDPDAAVHQLVDDLLASPHYAERWARHWLDQARYADSHGYTIDGDRIMWPYRDWVIRAIRDDMPFDQFTIEQIAGDLLPNPTKVQLVATGFHRNTLINQEGGTDPEQFRNEAVVDRVNTTGAVWLGLTLGCAQCHSHKFDPISQKEYYELFAFFNHCQDRNNTGPTAEVAENELILDFDSGLVQQFERAKSRVTELEESKPIRRAAWEKTQRELLSTRTQPNWRPITAQALEAAGGAPLQSLEDGSILAGKGAGKETYTISFSFGSALQSIAALRLRVIPHESLPKNGPGLAGNGNFVLTRFEIWQGENPIPIARASASHAQPGYAIENTIDGKSSTGWAINVGMGTPAGKTMNSEHSARFILAKPIAASDVETRIVLRHELNSAHYNIGRFALEASAVAPSQDYDESFVQALETRSAERTKEQNALVSGAFDQADAELKSARALVNRAREALGLGAPVRTMIMRELPNPRETYIHIRGDFLRKDKQAGLLFPGVPEILPSPSERGGDRMDRLDLARWLVSASNPLTARVTVNRVWMRYFGRGLVETENDFGSQGTPPTHPQLLDWLASSFMKNGWSMKQLHRLIVTSATYRQSSHHRKELVARDKRNLLLARQNRLRYDAEVIRDAALSASGLLNSRIGGPSVRPPQPKGVYAFTQTNKNWVSDTGSNRFRRAMYTRFYRSAPYPMLMTFDSPDFQSVCTCRPRSNTPLQSLTMANDPVFFEFAQGLAAHLLRRIDGVEQRAKLARIDLAFLRCFGRPATAAERSAVGNYFQLQLEKFRADREAADAVAPKSLPERFTAAEGAAWTSLARALMNTDEFVTRE